MNKKGISLLILIVTIVVILILSTTIITSLLRTSIIGQASEAKFKTDMDAFNSELTMYLSQKYIDSMGDFDAKNFYASTTTNPKITDVIPSMVDKKNGSLLYENMLEIRNGEISLGSVMEDETIIGWAQDLNIAPGITKVESTSTLWEFDQNTKTITKYLGTVSESLTIPNYIDGIPVKTILGTDNYSIFQDETYKNVLKELIISEGITTIDDYAFEDCYALTTLKLPNGLTSIEGNSAFNECTSLTNITIPNGVTFIGEYTFEDCDGLTSIVIPNSVKNIAAYAFYSCSNLATITIPESVQNLGRGIFAHCHKLVDIPVSESNTNFVSIDGIVFSKDQTKLILYPAGKTDSSYTIPDGVIEVLPSAFNASEELLTITLADSVTYFPESATDECYNIANLNANAGNSDYSSTNGVLFSKDYTVLRIYPQGREASTYSIPSSVTRIGEYAFEDCGYLTSMTIPNTVTAINRGAFDSCYNLLTTTLPTNITLIDSSTFYNCEKLTNISIPEGVTSIGYSAFDNCYNLTSVSLPSSLTIIYDSAFEDCEKLTNITLPNNLTTISYSAFSYCISLANITFPSSLKTIEEEAFYRCSSLTTLVIPNNITTIGECAFEKCTSLSSVTIGTGITELDHDIFAYCSSLTSITVPNNIVEIHDESFQNCTALTSVTIGSGIVEIEPDAFVGCTNLTNITINKTSDSVPGKPWSATNATVTWSL